MSTSGAESRAPSRLTAALKRRVVQQAIDFLVQVEELTPAQREQLQAVPIRWRRRRGRSRFYTGAAHGFSGPHILLCVGRGHEVRWHTYTRVRSGLTTPREGIAMPVPLYVSVVLVHELTHALQHGVCGTPKRRYSEVETTDNEIEFVRRMAPRLHAQLVPVRAAPQRRKAARIGPRARARTTLTRTEPVARRGLFGWLLDLLSPRPR